MKGKKWILVSTLLLLGIAGTSWSGWTFFSSANVAEPRNSDTITKTEKAIEEESEDFSTDVVNEPASKDVVVFSSNVYENGHDFIAEFHDFYNNTLCWGRVKTADYKDQKDTALRIVEAFTSVEVNDERLYDDFESIENAAKQVIASDDREAMVILHRLFHDLDIHFNGYSKDNIFGVTEFN